jgi:hypothetical protein
MLAAGSVDASKRDRQIGNQEQTRTDGGGEGDAVQG